MDLYYYEDQQFRYEDGRLLLRGNNGTGKSRVLALQLPFLFDGDINPARVEPDGDQSKRIEWHLLLNGLYDDRIGYTWIELGRIAEDGPVFCTLGCGMHAHRGRGAPKRWHFITGRRIGIDLHLKTDKGTARNAARLREHLGDDGQVYERDRLADYRAAVDRELFGLGTERYRALVELLIQLRRPQLSRRLDEKVLSNALSEALPPPSPAVLDDVAEAFRGLEGDRDQLAGYRHALDATERFVAAYRRYVQIAFRRAAGDVRSEHASYEGASRKLKTQRDIQEQAERELEQLGEALQGKRSELEGAKATVETLRSDPAMADAHRLDTAVQAEGGAAERLKQAERTLERALEDCEDRTHDAELAVEALADAERLVEGARKRCRHLAREIGSAMLDEVALAERVDGAVVARAVEDRRRHAAHLGELEDQLEEQRDRLRTAELERDRSAEHLAAAREDEALAVRARNAARDVLVADIDRWVAELRILEGIDADPLMEAVLEWADTSEGDGPVSVAVREAHGRAVDLLATERSRLESDRQRVAKELETLEQERDRLEKGEHQPPAAPGLRDPESRAHMEGAPLWALCDFRDTVPEAERAGFEAALEASGLLDAWVTPDGRLLAGGVHDTAAVACEPVEGPSLADVLEHAVDPADQRASRVDPRAVAGILAGIGSAPGERSPWIAADGHFSLGPLAGAAHKDAAEHVGQGAREQARRRRLAQLAEAVAGASAALERCDHALEDHRARRELAEQERAAAPSEEALRDAAARLATAQSLTSRLVGALADAEREVAARAEDVERASTKLQADAKELALLPWVGRLSELRLLLSETDGAFRELTSLLSGLARASAHVERAERARRTAARAADEARRHLGEREGEHEAARAARAALEHAVGAKVQEIQAKLKEARSRVSSIQAEMDELRDREKECEKTRSTASGKAEVLEGQVATAEQRRNASAISLQRVARTGLLPEAHGDLVDVDPGPEWSANRAVEIARRIEKLLAHVPAGEEDRERSNSVLQGQFSELGTSLLGHDLRPQGTYEAELLVVTIPFQGRPLHPTGLRDALADEIVSRERILDEREREILENSLIGDVAAHLVELVREGELLVARMNEEVTRRPTSTGMRFRFRWEPVPGDDALVAVRKKLMAAHAMWSPDDREAIGRFLQERIQQERESAETGTWREHLQAALDYRRWHQFAVEREQNGHWQRLTKRTYGTGSGGEKAIALTLPLVAAAAAHYWSAAKHAPRLILFDEAFVGIDSDMRGKCMELLRAFDLDFVMTSEREWGCYATVPALAIYQLATHPGISAVHATRWVWNGRDRVKDDSPDDLAHEYAAE